MPPAQAIGIPSLSVTLARMRRIPLGASRNSRRATSSAREMWREMPAAASLRRSRFSQLMVVPPDREVDVLQGRQLTKLTIISAGRALVVGVAHILSTGWQIGFVARAKLRRRHSP